MANPSRMNKTDLIEYAKTYGITAGKTQTKKDLLAAIKASRTTEVSKPKQKSMAKPNAKANKAKKKSIVIGKPVMIPQKKPAAVAPKDKSIWQTVKDFFGV